MMEPCPTCNQEIAADAGACPNCGKLDPFGKQTAAQQQMIKPLGLVVNILLVAAIAFAVFNYLT